MNILLDEHKTILIQLLHAKVEFILIGGYAVIYHGYGRTTGDMDIWLKPDNENRDKLITVMEMQGILKEDIDHIRNTDCGSYFSGSRRKKKTFTIRQPVRSRSPS